jgi:hypothetical protein
MRVFQASIDELLWPEKREHDSQLRSADSSDTIYLIDRTTAESSISIPTSYVPEPLRRIPAKLNKLAPKLFGADGSITIGPFPKGLPVNLLSNLQPLPESDSLLDRAKHTEKLVQLLVDLKLYLLSLPAGATDEQKVSGIGRKMGPTLLALNKCPDFEVNRGHYFGTSLVPGEPALSDSDKRALIEFLKTF